MSGSRGFEGSQTGDNFTGSFYADVDRDLNVAMQRMNIRANNNRDVIHGGESVGVNAGAFRPPGVTSSVLPGPSGLRNNVTNLESFMESVTPIVPARMPLETDLKNEMRPYFYMGDLWDSFEQWSAYGAEVPFVLSGQYHTTQFYVPFISGMQLFIDPTKTKTGSVAEENGVKSQEPDQQTSLVSDDSSASLNNQKGKQIMSMDNGTEVYGSRSELVFQYMEYERPHKRMPLSALAASLDSRFPDLCKYRSCDLLPSSWICVAWYPIYRIPMGPSTDNLEACFLTLHALSTQPKNYNEGESSSGSTHAVHVDTGLSSTIRLPVFGMVSNKLKGSLISPIDRQECEQECDLFNAAANWLNNVQARVPDYGFFISRYK